MPEIGLGVLSCDLQSVIRVRGWPGGERRGAGKEYKDRF